MGSSQIAVTYDRPVDVLHIVIGTPEAYEGDGLPCGLEIDYSIATGVVCGAKVIGFERNGWRRRIDELALELSHYLPLDGRELMRAVEPAINL